MTTIKLINQATAFLLELTMLFMLGYGGYQIGKPTPWQYALAIGLPVLAIVLWGYFAAPRSTHRLVFPYLTVFRVCIFGSTACLWYKSGNQPSAFAFMIVVFLNEIITLAVGR